MLILQLLHFQGLQGWPLKAGIMHTEKISNLTPVLQQQWAVEDAHVSFTAAISNVEHRTDVRTAVPICMHAYLQIALTLASTRRAPGSML